jgi:hypothetical protein
MFHFSEDETDNSPNGQLQRKMARLMGEAGPSTPATIGIGISTPSPRKKSPRDRDRYIVYFCTLTLS